MAKKKIKFTVATNAHWWIAVHNKDVPIGTKEIELEPADEPYVLVAYFFGNPEEEFEVKVQGGVLDSPIKSRIPTPLTRSVVVRELKVAP